jgi:ubiquinone/menaquinone biosynthesis C-methylase UbiE
MRGSIYSILENPIIYRLSQMLLAPGGERSIRKLISTSISYAESNIWLDVGCGPMSLCPPCPGKLYGVDISPGYIKSNEVVRNRSAAADATSLPFKRAAFAGVITTGLLHHLSDHQVCDAQNEMIRVCEANGEIIVIDAVLPHSVWRRPQAQAIRKADRGEYMRTQSELEALLHRDLVWQLERKTYTWNGLEVLIAKSTNS